MSVKLIVSLIALCLTLSIVSVQAQAGAVGYMDSVDVVLRGDIAETIKCNVTGNAFIVEEMDNATEETDNATEDMDNATEEITCAVTGKMLLIKDLGNMTEKAVIVGKMDSVPGNVVIFGKMDNVTEGMNNMTEGMDNMTVLMSGNVTGKIMCNMTENMDTATEDMDNMTVLMAGNMTGNITGEMTRETILINNTGNMSEMAEKMCNMTWTTDADNMTESTACNMTGKMIVIKNTDDMTGIEEEDIEDMVETNGDTAVIGNVDNTEMDKVTGNTTGKIIIIKNMDDKIQIVTKPIMFNTTQDTSTIENMD